MKIRAFEVADTDAVVALWEVAGLTRPWNDPRKDIARILIAEGERLLIERGCPKLMLMVRADNAAVIDLYERLGYESETTIVMGKRLIPDS